MKIVYAVAFIALALLALFGAGSTIMAAAPVTTNAVLCSPGHPLCEDGASAAYLCSPGHPLCEDQG